MKLIHIKNWYWSHSHRKTNVSVSASPKASWHKQQSSLVKRVRTGIFLELRNHLVLDKLQNVLYSRFYIQTSGENFDLKNVLTR